MRKYSNLWKIYGMNYLQLLLLEWGFYFIKITRPLRVWFDSRPISRNAHWVQSHPRPPRYERQMFWLLIITAIVMSRPETIYFNVLIGAALSFSFILYVLIRMLFSNENE